MNHEPQTTTVLPHGCAATLDRAGNLIIEFDRLAFAMTFVMASLTVTAKCFPGANTVIGDAMFLCATTYYLVVQHLRQRPGEV